MLGVLRGVISLGLFVINTLTCCFMILGLALVSLPFFFLPRVQKQIRGAMDGMVAIWVAGNARLMNWFRWITLEKEYSEKLNDRNHWWLIASNHQSWADIIILQIALHRIAPTIKFFTKRELIWLPVLGFVMWVLRFPYVHRRKSSGRGKKSKFYDKNRASLDRAAEQFSERPLTVLVFLEGTRFTKEKHQQQQSGYRHLLRPKVGGLIYALDALEPKINQVVSLTVVYDGTPPGFFDLMCGQCRKVRVYAEPAELTGIKKTELRTRITHLWNKQDQLIQDTHDQWSAARSAKLNADDCVTTKCDSL